MKRLFAAVVAMTMVCSLHAQAQGITVTNIDPPYWWIGMANDTLQLLISGKDIGNTTLKVGAPGVKLVETVDTDSPNYKLVYLTIGDDARPGEIDLRFSRGKDRLSVPYTLKARDWRGEDNPGFDASDVLYLIMPDRFADGDESNNALEMRNAYHTSRDNLHGRHGGDIKGMLDHLDYIDDLGVTAVWVNPVLENDVRGGSYHGYATTDYYRIDPRFGTNDEWNRFVEACHDRGIKVVMDMIFNHSGSDHPWMDDMPMSDWYNHPQGDVMTNHKLIAISDPYVSEYDLDACVNGWFVRGMPDLNQRNRHMMNYLIQNSIFWIESSKIDGIRMDTYPYADKDAMARWIAEVEAEYPHFNIVGECWYASEGAESFWQRGSLTNAVDPNLLTVMDFYFAIGNRDVFLGDDGYNRLYDHLALDFLFPDPQHILTFLDNHDTDRFLASMPDDLGGWRQAMTYLLTSRGIPQIYYGTEILMNGTRAEGGDGNVRRDMPGGFPGDTVSVFDPAGRTPMQAEAYDFLSKLLHWRKGAANDVIARGSLKHFIPNDGVYVYQRALDGRTVTVMLNGKDETVDLDMARYAEILPVGTSDRYTDVITGESITIPSRMTLAPRQTVILTNF